MAVRVAARLAARARPRVYCLVGDGGMVRRRHLRARDDLILVNSPRHATVLLIAGSLPEELWPSARQLHDQLPEPRLAAVWDSAPADGPFADAPVIADDDDPGSALVALHRELATGRLESRAAFGPADDPVPWRGVGPHGQGGEGMMGGKPYGRAMAMTGDDVRDGLALDRLPVTLGPFLPWLPAGLRLDLVLQGDLVQSASARIPLLRQIDWPEPMLAARDHPVSVAAVEMARARHHLEAVGDVLAVLGAKAMAERLARLAGELTPGCGSELRGLWRRLCTSCAVPLATHGLGQLDGQWMRGTGANARAAGIDDDARSTDPAYAGLGFEPITHDRGDISARIQQRLAEAAQAVELAERAEDRVREPGPALEGPRGSVGRIIGDADRFRPGGLAAAKMLDGFCQWASGRPFDELVTTLVSLDLDPAILQHSPCYQQSEEDHPCPR